jgi:hypothetical protein
MYATTAQTIHNDCQKEYQQEGQTHKSKEKGCQDNNEKTQEANDKICT